VIQRAWFCKERVFVFGSQLEDSVNRKVGIMFLHGRRVEEGTHAAAAFLDLQEDVPCDVSDREFWTAHRQGAISIDREVAGSST
jgi:hypothetical protein